MSKPALKLKRDKPDADVVSALEYFLDEAKAGRLHGFVLFGNGKFEDGTSCTYSKNTGYITLRDALEAFETWKFRRFSED